MPLATPTPNRQAPRGSTSSLNEATDSTPPFSKQLFPFDNNRKDKAAADQRSAQEMEEDQQDHAPYRIFAQKWQFPVCAGLCGQVYEPGDPLRRLRVLF